MKKTMKSLGVVLMLVFGFAVTAGGPAYAGLTSQPGLCNGGNNC